MDHQNPANPQQRMPQTPFQFSPEDEKILKECNREAFFQRCVPFSLGLSGLTLLAVKAGYLKGHATWGPTPKVMAALFFGYFAGKFSYQQKCAEKLMANPNSQIGAALRARRRQGGNTFQDALTMEMPGMVIPSDQPRDVYKDDLPPSTFTDLDTDRPYNGGLNESFQPNLDAPQRPEDFILPPQASAPNTYDELRRKNREDFERKMRPYRPAEGQPQPPPYNPPPTNSPPPFERYQPTNIYGDVFEK